MKQRFSSLDVRSTVATLQQSIVGLRLQNVYDVNSRTYLFKFSKPDRKELVLVESGVRMHTTLYTRDKSITPSGFCIKLRKHLRTRRLTKVTQLGSDRIVDYEFGADDPSMTYHIIAEFYAAGNLILTDGDYKILSLLRIVQPNESVRMAVGEIYNISALTRNFEPIDRSKLIEVLQTSGPKDVLKKVINTSFDYGPALTEHAILRAGLSTNLNVSQAMDTSEGSPQIQDLLNALEEADDIIRGRGSLVSKGYVIMLRHKKQDVNDAEEKELVTYDEFHPYLFEQHKSKEYQEFESFDAAVDEFFSAIESQRLELKRRSQEEAAQKKLDVVKMEHFGRVKGLEEAQQKNVLRAELIESNLEMCDQAIVIIRNAIATGMDWKDLADLVEEEKKRGNPIGLMIDSLKLETNQICVILTDPYDEEYGDEEEGAEEENEEEKERREEAEQDMEAEDRNQPKPKATMLIDLDIYLTAFANARNYYDVKKQSALKHEKTLAQSSKAFKSAEKKIRQDLKETKITTSIQKSRKPYWFEKFMWFITSENYLVIAGRDMQQNEMIVKRYMKKDDIYVHADLHGAASVLVKNSSDTGAPIPPSSLYQAGIMSVCQSKAWDAKIVTSAYWVKADQVTKSAPTGEYLTTGSFMIRGKKNFLPPVQLIYGFGFLFKLEESSIGAHLNERKAPKIEYDTTTTTAADVETAVGLDQQQQQLGGSGAAAVLAHAVEQQEKEQQQQAKQADEEEEEEEGQELAGSDGSDDEDEVKAKETAAPASAIAAAVAAGKEFENEDEDDEEEESDASSDDEDAFPDTQIQTTINSHNAKKSESTTATTTTTTGPPGGFDKYALQDYGDDSNDDEDTNSGMGDTNSQGSGAGNKPKSAYITAKMRRDMKKGVVSGANTEEKPKPAPPQQQQASANKKPQQQQREAAAVAAAQAQAAAAANVRGKKGKAKKIKDKYGDQDEDERQLRIELLAPDKGPQPKGKRAKREAEKRAEKEALAEKRKEHQAEYERTHGVGGGGGGLQRGGGGKKGGKGGENWGKPEGEFKGRKPPRAQPTIGSVVDEKDMDVGGANAHATKIGQDDVLSTTGVKTTTTTTTTTAATVTNTAEEDDEEVRRLLQEENIKQMDSEELENLTVLDGLTGQPLPNDILQFAVPVCGPYSALQKFKYRVKLIPGTMKKGKAVKTAVNHFLATVAVAPTKGPVSDKDEGLIRLEAREKELIRMVKDEELINSIIGKCKVSAPGVEASKKKGGGGGVGRGKK